MSNYTISDHTPAEYREMAQRRNNQAADSFDRCDTDGALSQWAWNAMASTYFALAALAEDGENGGDVQNVGHPFFRDADGEWKPVEEWKWCEGRYGSVIRIWNQGKVTWWNESQARKAATRQRNDEKKGLRWGLIKAEVHARTGRDGTSAYVVVDKVLGPVTSAWYPEEGENSQAARNAA